MNIIRHLRLAAIAAALALAAPALAQTPAQPVLTPIEKLTPSHIAAGKEVVMLSGIYRTFSAFAPAAAQRIFSTVTPTRPELRADLETVLKSLVAQYEKRSEEMIDTTAKIFASAMSEADLKAVAVFFKTEAGKKYVGMQPLVIDKMVVAADDWNRKIMDEMLTQARVEMKKKGKDM